LSQYEFQIGVKLFELQQFNGALNQEVAPELKRLKPQAEV
jgi:hypothetical protein